MLKIITKWIAIGFGTGLSPIMPGTVGTLLGLPLSWALMQLPNIPFQIGSCILFTALAIAICDSAEKMFNTKDPACIVADEYFTLPITVIGLTSPWALLSGFVFHRIFDITKPPPIKQIQNIGGGVGIVIDDVLAALIALGCNHLLWHFI